MSELEIRCDHSDVASVQPQHIDQDATSRGLDAKTELGAFDRGGVGMPRDVEAGVGLEVSKLDGQDVGRSR